MLLNRNNVYGSPAHKVLLDLTERLGDNVIRILMVSEDCT